MLYAQKTTFHQITMLNEKRTAQTGNDNVAELRNMTHSTVCPTV